MATPPSPTSGLANGASFASKLKKGLGGASKSGQSASNQATSAEHDLLSSARTATMAPAQMFHEGGKIEKDGIQLVDAKEGETVLPNEDKEKALELAVDHLKGMGEGLSHKGHKKESHKKEPEKKKAHGFHAKKVKGGWHVHHHDESDKPIPGDEHMIPDMDAMHGHMEDNFGEPNQGEAEADAGQHGVPEPQASEAGLPPMPGQGA